MPRLIDPESGDAIGIDDLADALADTDVDVRDEDSFASLGPLLARLGRNRSFLADMAVDELKQRFSEQKTSNVYGAQVLMLRPPKGRFILRANFWPARDDWVTRASGTGAFFYDMPHDHNFSFLTTGYLGPGYWSDYYEYDAEALVGIPGEIAGLRFIERSRLDRGKLMLYRMRRDVHVQLPPDRFSVSLNILGYDASQPWIDQYRFDIARDMITEGLTTSGSEALLTMALHVGCANAHDLAHDFAQTHPIARMRTSAIDALVAAAGDQEARHAIYARAAGSADPYVAHHATSALAAMDRLETAPERT